MSHRRAHNLFGAIWATASVPSRRERFGRGHARVRAGAEGITTPALSRSGLRSLDLGGEFAPEYLALIRERLLA
jgi:hypothetical protein